MSLLFFFFFFYLSSLQWIIVILFNGCNKSERGARRRVIHALHDRVISSQERQQVRGGSVVGDTVYNNSTHFINHAWCINEENENPIFFKSTISLYANDILTRIFLKHEYTEWYSWIIYSLFCIFSKSAVHVRI